MSNWTLIDSERLDGGSELTLYRDGDAFMIRADGLELMNSGAHGSEEAFVHMGLETNDAPHRLLIGGLGLGYTLAEALRRTGPDCQITVCEISAKVIAWNKGVMAELNPVIHNETRARILRCDLVDHVRATGSQPETYDLALLDIDNGPLAMVHEGNEVLYSPEGLRLLCQALSRDGVAVFWSAFSSPTFEERLGDFFKTVRVETFKLPQNSRIEHFLFIGSGPRTIPQDR